jgi:hypothetical protein
LVVWEWHGLGHIPLADSYATTATSPYFDAYHLNSIEPLPGGRLLVSARDTCAIYEIDRASGRIIWTLGGKASSFRMKRGTRFYFQHDAHLLAGNRVSLFDDEAGPPSFARSSRGLVLALDTRRHTATLARQYRRPGNDTLADSEGSLERIAGGNQLVGFGSKPFFSAFTATGRLVFDASLPVDDGSYRIFGAPWMATPRTRPIATVRRATPGHVDVYASWNGATTVAHWQLLAGASAKKLSPVVTAPSRDFETHIAAASSAAIFAVRALSSAGKVLASSAAVTPS